MGNIYCMLRLISDENDIYFEIYIRFLFYIDCFYYLVK